MQYLYPNNFSDELGQGLVEYGLILVMVSIAVVLVLGLFGDEVAEVFNEVTTAFSNA